MRAFKARDGTEWQVVVGRESWGTMVALFVSRRGGAPPRQTVLEAASTDEALKTLRALSPEELQELLDRAELKPME